MARRSVVSPVSAAVVLAALVVAGTAAAGGWPKHEPNAADQALAKRSVLHLSDFVPGSGWTTAPPDAGNDSSKDPCSSSDVGRVITGTADSSFQTTGARVWSSAEVMQTLDMARRDAKQASDPALISCMRGALSKEMPAGTQVVSFKRLPFPSVGDWATAYRMLVDVSAQGTKVRVQLDMVLVLSKRVEITLMQMTPSMLAADATAAEVRIARRLAGASLAA